MRKTLTLAAFAAAVLLVPATARAQFEGVITIVTHDKEDGGMTMVQWTMPDRYRLDMSRAASKDDEESGNGSMIIDRVAKTTTIVMPAQRMYMTSTIVDRKPMATRKPETEDDAKSTWTKTGRTETVAGITCEIYHGSSMEEGKKREADACLAKGVGFMVDGRTGAGPMGEGMGSRFARAGLPAGSGIMKMTTLEKGKVQVDMEVTKVDKRRLSVSDFQPPAGFQKFKRPQ